MHGCCACAGGQTLTVDCRHFPAAWRPYSRPPLRMHCYVQAADINAAHELEVMANSLLRELQQRGGSSSEAGALQDVLHAAARAAGLEAAA